MQMGGESTGVFEDSFVCLAIQEVTQTQAANV